MSFKLIPAEFVVSGSLLGKYTLAGEYLQSPDFVHGVSGWAIFGDGSAEFNNGTFRGLIEAAAIVLQGTSGQVLVYSGPPAAGNLIGSISGAAGTDAETNPYGAGVGAYVTVTAAFAGTYAIELADQTQPWGANVAALSFNNLTSKPTQAPAITGQAHATAGTNLNMQSGKSTAAAAGATVQVQDSVSSGISGGLVDVLAGRLQLDAADGTLYNCGHFAGFSTADQPISLTTFQTVCAGTTVAPGKYRVHAELTVTQGPNAAANDFRLGFTGTISQVRMKMVSGQDATNMFLATTTSNNGLLASHAWAAGSTYTATLHGVIIPNSTGTLSIQAAMSAAGDTFTVLALSDFYLEQIG